MSALRYIKTNISKILAAGLISALASFGCNSLNKLNGLERNIRRDYDQVHSQKTDESLKITQSKPRKLQDLVGNIIDNEYFTRKVKELGVDSKQLEDYVNMKDREGDYYFDSLDLLYKYIKEKATPDDIKEYIDITWNDGTEHFNSFEILSFYLNKISSDSVKKALSYYKDDSNNTVSAQGFFCGKEIRTLAYKIRLHSLFDLTEDDLSFQDIIKPKMLFVQGVKDWNGAFGKTTGKDFFKKIKGKYDVKFIFAENEKDIHSIPENLKDVELFILAGHGSKTTLSLGEKDLRVSKKEEDETYTIDISDKEFGDFLDRLNPKATIFLYACNNAGDNGSKINLATFIKQIANGRRVIASKTPCSASNIQLNKVYPLDIIIKDKENTYDSSN